MACVLHNSLPSCSSHSMDASAREARFEVTEEFARDAFRGLEDLKEQVDSELESLRAEVKSQRLMGGGAAAVVAAGAIGGEVATAAAVAAMQAELSQLAGESFRGKGRPRAGGLGLR